MFDDVLTLLIVVAGAGVWLLASYAVTVALFDESGYWRRGRRALRALRAPNGGRASEPSQRATRARPKARMR